MRDPKRIPKVLALLQAFWELHPDLRLWQIVSILEDAANRQKKDAFYIEDDNWSVILQEYIQHSLENTDIKPKFKRKEYFRQSRVVEDDSEQE